jgi:hypothetical protein
MSRSCCWRSSSRINRFKPSSDPRSSSYLSCSCPKMLSSKPKMMSSNPTSGCGRRKPKLRTKRFKLFSDQRMSSSLRCYFLKPTSCILKMLSSDPRIRCCFLSPNQKTSCCRQRTRKYAYRMRIWLSILPSAPVRALPNPAPVPAPSSAVGCVNSRGPYLFAPVWQPWFIKLAVQTRQVDGMGPAGQRCCRRRRQSSPASYSAAATALASALYAVKAQALVQ